MPDQKFNAQRHHRAVISALDETKRSNRFQVEQRLRIQRGLAILGSTHSSAGTVDHHLNWKQSVRASEYDDVPRRRTV